MDRANGHTMTTTFRGYETREAAEVAWWAWHDADAARWSGSMEEAEERCAAWVSGESEDGPLDHATMADGPDPLEEALIIISRDLLPEVAAERRNDAEIILSRAVHEAAAADPSADAEALIDAAIAAWQAEG